VAIEKYTDVLVNIVILIEDGKEICGADNFTVWLFNAENFFAAIAAHYFGCDFVGCEIDVDYFNAARERFDRETRQVAMW